KQEALGKLEAKSVEQTQDLALAQTFAAAAAWANGAAAEARDRLERVPPHLRAFDWHYRRRQFEGGPFTLYGHTDEVWSVAYGPAVGHPLRAGTARVQGTHGHRAFRGLQPGRHAPGHRRGRRDGSGLGRPHRSGTVHPEGARSWGLVGGLQPGRHAAGHRLGGP